MKPPIKAFVFDVYGTLFDVQSVKAACDEQFPGKGDQISQAWRTKQLDYFFTRHIMGAMPTSRSSRVMPCGTPCQRPT